MICTAHFQEKFTAMASLQYKNLIEEFLLAALSTGSVAGLREIVADIGPEAAAEIIKSLKSKGETPLLVAIKRQNFQMVKFLVDNLKADIGQLGLVWNGLKNLMVPPLFSAIIYGSSLHQEIINYLMDQDSANESSVVLNSIHSSNLPQEQKTNLLKLVGAVYVLRARTMEDEACSFGKKCWSVAVDLQGPSTIGILKNPHQLSEWARKLFGTASEFKTREDLDLPHSFDQLKIQAFLIVERIGRLIHRGPHPFFLSRLFEHRHLLARIQNTRRHFDILMLLLEGLRVGEWQVVINSKWAYDFVEEVSIQILFHFTNSRNLPANHPQKFSRFMDIFRCYSDLHFKCLQHPISKVSDTTNGICEWITNYFGNMPPLNPLQDEEFKQWLSQYIRDVNCHSGVRTPLQTACRLRSPIKLIRMLLDAGADPSAADEKGWAPLHFLLKPISPLNRDISACVHLLLDAGAHMDQLNSYGQTPLDFCKSLQSTLNQDGISDPNLDAIVKNFLPLSLSAVSAVK